MPIKLTCVCGKNLAVPDDAAGRRARCPACNAVVDVPGTAPEPPPSQPEELRPSGKMDEVVNGFVTDLARSREHAPELTQIAVALLIWAGVSFLLTFLGALFAEEGSLALWLLVHVPQSAAGTLLALAMIKCWKRTPEAMSVVAPFIVGANYVMFWSAAMSVRGWGALYFFVAVVSLGGYAFLYWYFRWHGAAALFLDEPEDDAAEPAPVDAARGREPVAWKGKHTT